MRLVRNSGAARLEREGRGNASAQERQRVFHRIHKLSA